MNDDTSTDVIIEALEVFTNHILYTREVYPPQIFRKRKMYNCPVFISIYPTLNKYITDVLITARQLKDTKQLKRVEIIFYRDEMCVYERYSFDITDDCLLAAARSAEDEYLLEFEQQLRTSLHTLSERAKTFNKLPRDARFKMQLHTTQSGFVKTCCGPTSQDFPWLQVSISSNCNLKEVTLLPLSVLESTGIKITAEV